MNKKKRTRSTMIGSFLQNKGHENTDPDLFTL